MSVTQSVPVLLSTTSVYPEPTAVGFELAAELGYDGVELMIFTDRVSQDPSAAASLAKHYGVKIGAVHAPCLLVTQRVWSSDPWTRLRRSVQAAEYLESPTVVIHPPFSWQKEYASKFSTVLDGLRARYPHVTVAVENMFPLKLGKRNLVPYRPHWDPTRHGYDSYTLDLSHCAASGADAIAMAERMGKGLQTHPPVRRHRARRRPAPRPGPRDPALRRTARLPRRLRLGRVDHRRGLDPQERQPLAPVRRPLRVAEIRA